MIAVIINISNNQNCNIQKKVYTTTDVRVAVLLELVS